MAKDATKCYQMLHDLTVKQQNTIDRLVAGDTDEQAAQAVGVHRVTISRWRSRNPTFQAALNARRQEIWCASADKVRSLLPKALDTLRWAMTNCNVQAAAIILKAAALDKLSPPGPTDPEKIFEAMVEARVKEKRAKRARTATKSDLSEEARDPNCRARTEAEDTAAAEAEIEAEIEAQLNDDDASLDKLPPLGPTDPGPTSETLVEARVREKRAKPGRDQTASERKDESRDPGRTSDETESTAAAKAELEAEIEARRRALEIARARHGTTKKADSLVQQFWN